MNVWIYLLFQSRGWRTSPTVTRSHHFLVFHPTPPPSLADVLIHFQCTCVLWGFTLEVCDITELILTLSSVCPYPCLHRTGGEEASRRDPITPWTTLCLKQELLLKLHCCPTNKQHPCHCSRLPFIVLPSPCCVFCPVISYPPPPIGVPLITGLKDASCPCSFLLEGPLPLGMRMPPNLVANWPNRAASEKWGEVCPPGLAPSGFFCWLAAGMGSVMSMRGLLHFSQGGCRCEGADGVFVEEAMGSGEVHTHH